MKLCHYKYRTETFWGAIKDDSIFPFENLENLKAQNESIKLTDSIKFTDVNFLPPVSPSKIVCVGRNYTEHAAELGNAIPEEPLLFLKASSSIIVEGETIFLP